jgi:RNA polymerase sigma factor (TIGR02999 family)
MQDLHRAMEAVEEGRHGASERLTALLYEELRSLARREMAGERPDHTLQPTALAHEAYLRLAPDRNGGFESRGQFLAAAAVAIRRVLVEHARSRARLKRGGDRARVELSCVDPAGPVPDDALLELDEALVLLAEEFPVHARTVELRFFSGLTIEEIAAHRGVSVSTIQREWRFARAWLRGELGEPDGE